MYGKEAMPASALTSKGQITSDILIAHGGGSSGNSTLTFDVSGNTTRQTVGNPLNHRDRRNLSETVASALTFGFFKRLPVAMQPGRSGT